jgi:CSLREA domain-containing protein
LGLGILLGVLLGGFFPLEAGIIFVNTYADVIVNDGNCSLREAIIAANTDSAFNGCSAGSGADVIVLGPGTFTLSLDSTPGDEDSANEDDLDITSPITIVVSPPSGIATIARDSSLGCNLNGTTDLGEFRIFEVHAPGGSLSATNVILENGCADGGYPDDRGGGIYVQPGASLNLSTSTVRQNRANGAGGGILNWGTATLTDTTLSQNSAGQAGGGLNDPGTGTLLRCTVEGNSAVAGGGIFEGALGLTVLNSTISGNSASAGGGILIDASTVNLVFSTVTNNSAPTGAGVRLGALAPTLNSKNSIVGGNTGGANCSNAGGTINVSGANLANDGSCTGFANTPSLNLGPLANNGGPTQTHALLAGSSAINAVPSGQCTDLSSNPVTQDQRGVVRPQLTLCDVGAFEVAATDMQANPFTPPAAAFSPGGTYTGSFSCTNIGSAAALNANCTLTPSAGTVTITSCTPSNPPVSSLPANGVLSCNYTFTAPGSQGGGDTPETGVTFTVTAGADNDTNASNNTSSSAAVPLVDALDDAVSLPANTTGATFNLGSNDQVGTGSPPAGASFTLLGATCTGASVNSSTGVAMFNVPASGTCTVQYQLCYNQACDTATLTVTAVEPIPTLDRWGLLALLACLATAGMLLLRRVVA